MPGPFPGMDPWLESHHVWKGFHDALIVKTTEVLQPTLRQAGYYIDIGERVWIAEDDREIWPDNLIFRRSRQPRPVAATDVAVADEPVRVTRFAVEVRETFAEIFTREHELVTVLEFVSPSNKREGQGRNLYKLKQQELREASVHLVEVDLLCGGSHVLDVPEAVVLDLKPWDDLVNLARRESTEVRGVPHFLA